MSSDEVQVTLKQVSSYAWNVRNQYGGREDIVGQCDYMCYRLKDELSGIGVNREEMTVEQRRIGSEGRENHYILVISDTCLNDCDTNVWVDLSLDQFCDENKSAGLVDVSLGRFDDIEPVRVMNGSDERRELYMSVQEFLSKSFSNI